MEQSKTAEINEQIWSLVCQLEVNCSSSARLAFTERGDRVPFSQYLRALGIRLPKLPWKWCPMSSEAKGKDAMGSLY